MHYDTLLYDLADNVATITLHRPDRMNSLNTAMRAELLDALSRAPGEARTREVERVHRHAVDGGGIDVDVAAIPAGLGGGGHRRAAGARLSQPLPDARNAVIQRIEQLLSR